MENSMKNFLSFALVASFALPVFATEVVTRKEKTGNERVMVVGDCVLRTDVNFDGETYVYYELPLTKCVEYKTYQANKIGSGWNAEYEKISEDVMSYKMEISTEKFSASELYSTCRRTKNLMEKTVDMRACE
jgi:hypothetical protein